MKYFIKRGSKTHCVSLDASKAFDKVLHNGLFVKMLNRDIPVSLVRILVFWYSDLSLAVIWNGVTGECFKAVCGVRQGGVLSPYLYSSYVDELIDALRSSGLAYMSASYLLVVYFTPMIFV